MKRFVNIGKYDGYKVDVYVCLFMYFHGCIYNVHLCKYVCIFLYISYMYVYTFTGYTKINKKLSHVVRENEFL